MILMIAMTVGGAILVAGVWKDIDNIPYQEKQHKIVLIGMWVAWLFITWGLYFNFTKGG